MRRSSVRPTKDQLLMSFAQMAATRSTCSRLNVGCVLSDKAREMISFGYNGGPKGGRNECAREDVGRCGCLHAEINAVIKAPRGLTIAYCTDLPCEACATALVNYGIKEVYYARSYRVLEGLNVLENAQVHCINMGGFEWV